MGVAKYTGERAHGEHFFKLSTENLLRCARLYNGSGSHTSQGRRFKV